MTRETATQIESLEDAWTALFEESPTPMLLVEMESSRILQANRSAETSFGYGTNEMSGVTLPALFDHASGSPADHRVVAEPSDHPKRVRHQRRDGTAFDARVHVRPLSRADTDLLLMSIIEVPDSDLLDPGSGLPDERVFVDRLEQDISHAHRTESLLTVCLLSSDGLEASFPRADPNASFRLLHEIALRLRSNVRESDTVARSGHAEFGLILDGVGEEKLVVEILRKIAADFEYEFDLGDEPITLDLTIGAAIYPRDGHEATMLLENARSALESAQAKEPGQIEFYATSA